MEPKVKSLCGYDFSSGNKCPNSEPCLIHYCTDQRCYCAPTPHTKKEGVVKDTNPKDAVGIEKVPIFSVLPMRVLAGVALALLEGARKYGRHNYRPAGVRASVYMDAVGRHLAAWYEGEDIDPDSGVSHIDKAIAGLMVLRDSMLHGNLVDDRPPAVAAGWVSEANNKAKEIIAKYPNARPASTEKEIACST